MSVFSVARSGIAAGLLRQQVVGGNVANVSTEGYVPRRVELASQPGGGVSASIRSSGAPAVQLSEEVVEMVRAGHDVGVQAAVIRRADDVVGSLLDILA